MDAIILHWMRMNTERYDLSRDVPDLRDSGVLGFLLLLADGIEFVDCFGKDALRTVRPGRDSARRATSSGYCVNSDCQIAASI
jgi:hypothetical protein